MTSADLIVLLGNRATQSGHEYATREAMARGLAQLSDREFGGDHDASTTYQGHVYFVPDETLLLEQASTLGIRSPDDLLGGVVPAPFVATKSITHPAVDPAEQVPEGWSTLLGEALRDVTLPGFSVFAAEDAKQAARLLLSDGRVRFKAGSGIGGSGQAVIATLDELDQVLERMPAGELRVSGAVLERNLEKETTLSVGELQLFGTSIAYHGRQRQTVNHRGHSVYGGSDLTVIRGHMADLLALDLPQSTRAAIMQAKQYDAEVTRAFPGMFASRRNYDVVSGIDAAGRQLSGVLEQSWRFGGASPAELAAFEVLVQNPHLEIVHASSHEVYSTAAPPAEARVHYCGADPAAGDLTKYTLVQADGRPA